MVPSLLFVLTVIASTFLSYNHHFQGKTGTAGILCAAAFFLVFLPVLVNSTPLPAGKASPAARALFLRGLALITMNALLAACIFARVGALVPAPGDPGSETVRQAEVLDVTNGRYRNEIIFKIVKKGGGDSGGLCAGYAPPEIKVRTGDTIEFSARLRRSGSPGEDISEFSQQLVRRGIPRVCSFSEKNFRVIRPAQPGPKERLRDLLSRNSESLFSRGCASLVKALYFGNANYVDKGTVQEYKKAGVMHVLAASGDHISVIASISLGLFGLLRVRRKMILGITLLLLFAYLALTDVPVSLLRACLMFGLYALQEILDLDRNIFNVLFLGAAVILVLSPFEIYGLGFQLSFGATLGILLFFRFYKKSLEWLPSPLASSLALTLSAQVPVIPIILFHMKEINLSGIIANIVVVPLVSGILVSSITSNLLYPLCVPLARFTALIPDAMYEINRAFVGFVGSLQGHFCLERVPWLLAPCLLLATIPLLPGTGRKRIFSTAPLLSYLLCWLVLLNPSAGQKQVLELPAARSRVTLARNNNEAAVIGDFGEDGDGDIAADMINRWQPKRLSLYITKADYTSISEYVRLIRKTNATTCYLVQDFQARSHMQRLFSTLDRDGIPLVLIGRDRSALCGRGEICPGDPGFMLGLNRHNSAGSRDKP